MSRTKLISLSSCIIVLLMLDAVSCIGIENKGALIFERFKGRTVLLPKVISKTATCGDWATACPVPKSAAGDDLIKNAMVVKEMYNEDRKMIEVKMKICEDPFKIAIAYDIVKRNFRFGYAIYYSFNDEKYFSHDNLKYFMAPEKITEIMKKYSMRKGKYLRGEGKKIRNAVKNDKRVHNDYIKFNGDQRMEFMWIHMFNLKFDFYKLIIKEITYSILLNSQWPKGEDCVDYSLGFEVYQQTNVDDLYSQKNQNEIFKSLEIPAKECTGETCPISACKMKNFCLSKWLLIPMDQFNFGSSTNSVCSNLATVPIWTERVEEILKKVDQYLYTLNRIVGKSLLIASGVSPDVLKLPLKEKKFWNRTSEVYLDPSNEKIPVPKIIYKLVRYRFRPDPDSQVVLYSALIVIHNDPYYKKKTLICREDFAKKWGWQEITKDSNGHDFENIYVCDADGEVLSKVMGGLNAARQPESKHLNLESFSSPANDGKNTLKKKVDEEFHSISQGKVGLYSDDELLERDEEIFPLPEDEENDDTETDTDTEADEEEEGDKTD